MSKQSISLADLPTEILSRILSFFTSEDTRTLRFIIVACFNTDHKHLAATAENILQDQRTWLLARWRKILTKTQVLQRLALGIELLAESILGKQYISADDVVEENDQLVLLSLPQVSYVINLVPLADFLGHSPNSTYKPS